jgi:O-methyltransferase
MPVSLFKKIVKNLVRWSGYEIYIIRTSNIRDDDFYSNKFTPSFWMFSPWLGYGNFQKVIERAQGYTACSPDRIWILTQAAQQCLHIEGDFVECGVYRGGTAGVLADMVEHKPGKKLRLFDTFDGMPEVDTEKDLHAKGDFSDASLSLVKKHVGKDSVTVYYQGLIPDTFNGLEGMRIAFAHIDVDIFSSVRACCEFIFPRLTQGGILVFDDYGFKSCPGAREAVDDYFRDTGLVPLVLPTGQAVVFKSFEK